MEGDESWHIQEEYIPKGRKKEFEFGKGTLVSHILLKKPEEKEQNNKVELWACKIVARGFIMNLPAYFVKYVDSTRDFTPTGEDAWVLTKYIFPYIPFNDLKFGVYNWQ